MRVRDCSCPGTPHEDGDEIYLRPALGLEGGLEAEGALLESVRLFPLPENASEAKTDEVASQRATFIRPRWFATFIRHGAIGWNLVDEKGRPVPFEVEKVLEDYSLARLAAEEANDLYSNSVLAPFQDPPAKPSLNGRTDGGIHPPSQPTRKRSRRSSPPASVDGVNLTG